MASEGVGAARGMIRQSMRYLQENTDEETTDAASDVVKKQVWSPSPEGAAKERSD